MMQTSADRESECPDRALAARRIRSIEHPFNDNAVQLDPEDGGDGWPGGLGPVAVVGAFDVPFGHLAFDHTRVRSVASDRVDALAQQDKGVGPAPVSGQRGKNRAPVKASGE